MSVAVPDSIAPTVRPAMVDDAAVIAQIYAEHVRTGSASFDTVPRSAEDMATKISEIGEQGWPFLVALRDSRVVGYAYASQFRDRPAYSFACEDSIYVDANEMGRGTGTALLRALIDEATACGFRQMFAIIGGGEPASVALHAKLGFEHAGRMRSVGRKFGVWLDTVYMQLALGDGDTRDPDWEPG